MIQLAFITIVLIVLSGFLVDVINVRRGLTKIERERVLETVMGLWLLFSIVVAFLGIYTSYYLS